MKTYRVKLTGESPLLMRQDNIEWKDQLTAYYADPLNKDAGKAGDDRQPAWTWIGNCYHDGKNLGLPSDNIMSCVRDGAAMITKKGRTTFKSQSQSGILVNEIIWPIEAANGFISWLDIEKLMSVNDFDKHKEIVELLGFSLFVKQAGVNQKKHTRVRPRFDVWSATGTITIFDEDITQEVLDKIFYMCGTYCGIGDWRPKSPKKPGQFGKFTAQIKEIKNG